MPAARYSYEKRIPTRPPANGILCNQALLGGLKLVAGFGESFMEDVLTGVCDISGVSFFL